MPLQKDINDSLTTEPKEYCNLAYKEFKIFVLKKLNKLQENSQRQINDIGRRYMNKMNSSEKRLKL